MRTPEEFTRHLVDECLGFGPEWHMEWSADLIRARDAEVAEQARAEFEDMEHRLSVLLCNLTGGLLSKTGYDVATMEQHIEDYFEREVVEPARAEVRAETLAEFTEERDTHHRLTRVPCDCEHPMHARLLGDDSPPTHVSAVPVRVRRYVTPWKPDES